MKPDPHLVDSQWLQRCISDIAGLVALPARWERQEYEPAQIADDLLDHVFSMLELDFAHLQIDPTAADAAIELTRFSPWTNRIASWKELEARLAPWRLPTAKDVPRSLGLPDSDVRIHSLCLGLSGDSGILIVGTRRPDFPHPMEELLLTVAVNQATLGLQTVSKLREVSSPGAAHGARIIAMRQLAASLAHDLCQPLAGIMTNASTGLRMLSADPPDVVRARETARRTIRDTKRAAEIVGRLRTLCDECPTKSEAVDLEAAMPSPPSLPADAVGGR